MKFSKLKSLLLEGKKDAYERFVKTHKIHEHDFEKLLEKDPTPQKKYIEWICKIYEKEHNDINLFSVLKDFDDLANRNQITQKDIYSYNTLESVIDVVNAASGEKSKSQMKKEKRGIKSEEDIDPADIAFKNDKLIVVYPKTEASSIKYGRGSRWCTAADTQGNMFKSYRRNSHVMLYYFLPRVDVSPFIIGKEEEIVSAMKKRRSAVRSKISDDQKEAIENLTKVALAVYENGRMEAFYKDDSSMRIETLRKFIEFLGADPVELLD